MNDYYFSVDRNYSILIYLYDFFQSWKLLLCYAYVMQYTCGTHHEISSGDIDSPRTVTIELVHVCLTN